MLTEERHQRILDILERKGSVTAAELMQGLDASESTIRRDLHTLAAQGKLKKVHGGAIAAEYSGYATTDDEVELRKERNIKEKLAIARYAAGLIREDDFVFLDAGTTTLLMVDFIEAAGASFVTNGIEHARLLARRGLTTYLVGGEFKATTEAIVGEEAVTSLAKYNFTKGFLGTNGITFAQGFTTPEVREAMLKHQAMCSSREVYVLADAAKFGEIAPISFGTLEDGIILTDGKLPEEYKTMQQIVEVNSI